MTVSGQPAVSYAYDNANRLLQITQGSSVVTFGYDAAGRRTSLTLPNGILVEYTYDAASRVTGINYKQGATVLGNLTYEYDKGGNRTKIGGSFARTGIPNSITSASYNAANQQTALGDKSLIFDNNGNLTSITDAGGTTLYTWNPRNQLTSINGPSVNASFVYDGLGRREKKTINGSLTEFLYDRVNPVQETSGATVLANILTGLGVDEYVTRTDVPAGTTSNLLPDALGSTIALADSSGAVQSELTYEPFGKTTVTGPTNTNPFQYTGRENEGTGLYYYRARYYHPQLQRFISEDPVGLGGGDINLYAYVGNDPMNLVDPLGQIGFQDLIHHPGFKALLEDLLSRLLEHMGSSPCPNRMNALANLIAGVLSAVSSAHAGQWAYGVGGLTTAGLVNPVTGSAFALGLGVWSIYEFLRSAELIDRAYRDFKDPCQC